MNLTKAVTYDDVLLTPQYSDIRSRKEIDIGNDLDENIYLDLPILSSPMDTVTESEMAITMCEAGGLGVIHRYNEIDEQCGLVADTFAHAPNKDGGGYCANIAAAVGVSELVIKRSCALWENGANIICIDVAHGHHVLVKEAIENIRIELGSKVHIMAGNVATLEAFNDLVDWGADSVRCNIGGGSICTTRTQTGHGIPGLQTIMECAKSNKRNQAKIIADGGIKNSGDIVKALAAGADFVMLGSLLAGTDEAPGEAIVTSKGEKYKKYRGMASKDAQMDWRGRASSNEGLSAIVSYKGSVQNILSNLAAGIASGLSYSGARDIKELQEKAKFIMQTPAGQQESWTHILGAR